MKRGKIKLKIFVIVPLNVSRNARKSELKTKIVLSLVGLT